MASRVSTVIDREKCIGCGLCVKVCPAQTLSMVDGKAAVTGSRSISCGHCAAVCPVNAVKVTNIDDTTLDFHHFTVDEQWLPYGGFSPQKLAALMLSRRSCRNYTDQTVERTLLEDLVKFGISAPSGTNSQKWTFTILPSRQAIVELDGQTALFFERLNRKAEKNYLRFLLKLAGKKELDGYYRRHYEYIQKGLDKWRSSAEDMFFHGATATIIVGSKIRGASCPREDALLATQNILIAAHSLGLGSCLIGFAVEAMKRDKAVRRSVGIPDDETIYTVIALGYPDEVYQRLIGRKKVAQRFAPF